jgi:hypothetical protein
MIPGIYKNHKHSPIFLKHFKLLKQLILGSKAINMNYRFYNYLGISIK